MSKLLITTQVYENYGDIRNPHWKAKGGNDYVVRNFVGERLPDGYAAMKWLRQEIECDDHYFREFVIDFQIVADDYLTQFERDQLEYEGKITYPARELSYN